LHHSHLSSAFAIASMTYKEAVGVRVESLIEYWLK